MTELPVNQVIAGDCLDVMRDFPGESINLVMFSPPYWGLRDYGIDGQIGLEPTYQEYVAKMVEVGREVRRVLRGDGSWYLNLGDTYYTAKGTCFNPGGGESSLQNYRANPTAEQPPSSPNRLPQTGIFPKCKLLIPYRVALALIDARWTCRNDITWYKPNATPSSVTDRLTCQTERVFHFVKSRKYYYDLDAIREPHSAATIKRVTQPTVLEQQGGAKQDMLNPITGAGGNYNRPAEMVKSIVGNLSLGKNPGDFWPYVTISSDDYWCPNCRNFVKQEDTKCVRCEGKVIAHFAVYPEQLCDRPIRSSCPPNGIVLDPMCGSGTTLVVAKRMGRRYIGIDLNPDYCEMARKRLGQVESPLEVFA